MAVIPILSFTDICLNGQLKGKLDGNVKNCNIYQKEGRWVESGSAKWIFHDLNSQVLSWHNDQRWDWFGSGGSKFSRGIQCKFFL